MKKRIRWGILGTGRIAKLFCEMLVKLEGAEVYAVGSRKKETAEDFAKTYGIPLAYGSYEELAADGNLDIIYVATPIGSHYENMKLCLEAGRNVLCEKAFTRTAGEAEELYRLSREKKLFLMEAMWMKCQPVHRRILEWNREGRLGEIQGVEARFYTKAAENHRLLQDINQGGSLYDLTVYPITYSCALLGYEPKRIHALAAKGKNDVDTMESIQLVYENGSFASLTGGLACERQVSLYIHGTKGRICMDQEHYFKAQKAELLDWNNQVTDSIELPFAVNGYEYEAMEAMECVSNGRTESALVPVTETIQVIKVMEECRRQWNGMGHSRQDLR